MIGRYKVKNKLRTVEGNIERSDFSTWWLEYVVKFLACLDTTWKYGTIGWCRATKGIAYMSQTIGVNGIVMFPKNDIIFPSPFEETMPYDVLLCQGVHNNFASGSRSLKP